ncbi:hypothetical protein [Mesorhizobium sp. CAU 1732]|uniref:hypothetical protein n=1 Tax=Mesorhizobium sp. CAU 1732 TaxID=3140358 RepID=UPI00326052E5
MMSNVGDDGMLVRVQCCHVRYYRPEDLIALFGNFQAVKIERYVRTCERGCSRGFHVDFSLPSAAERQAIRVRKLKEIKLIKRPIWRDE